MYCKIYKDLDQFYNSTAHTKQSYCKDCVTKLRKEKRDEYNKKRNERRKISKEGQIYNKKRYEKLKDNPEEYQKFRKKVNDYKKQGENWKVYALSTIKCRALRDDLPFNLTKDDLLVPEKCPLLGTPLIVGSKDTLTQVSWDKIIPELGYVKGNVRAISRKANTMKNDATPEMLETFAKNIIPYMNSRFRKVDEVPEEVLQVEEVNQ